MKMSGFSRTISGSSERLTQNEPAVKSPTNQATAYPSGNRLNPAGTQFSAAVQPPASSSNPNSPHTSSAASSVNSLIDQEELANLTNYVKHFREQLSKLRRLLAGELALRKDGDANSPFSKDSSIKDLSNKDLYSKDHPKDHPKDYQKERSSSKDLSPRGFFREPSVKESGSSKESGASKEPAKESTSKELPEKQEMFKAQVHDKLADVLRILKAIFERFVQVQSSDLFACSKNLIEAVKGFDYADSSAIGELNDLLDKIDQLAVCFSNRVSEYLMEGDCSAAQCAQQPKAKASAFDSANKFACDSNNNNLNQPQTVSGQTGSLANSADNPDLMIWNSVYNLFHKRVFPDDRKKEDPNWDTGQAQLSSDECDEIMQKMNSAVEFALQNAKLWSKYIKDISIYIEKRINYEMESSKNLLKLAQTIKPILKENDNLPLQQLYLNMLDLDIKNHKAYFANCSLILGHKFLDPLTVLRNENEKCRKSCKNQWTREYKKLCDSVSTLKKSRSTYIAKKIELERAKQALKLVLETGTISSTITSSHNLAANLSSQSATATLGSSGGGGGVYMQSGNYCQLNHIQMESSSEQVKLDKKRKYEEDALQKAIDAENTYRNAVIDANERARTCENIKKTILNRIKDLDYKSDLTLTSVTGNYLQIQKLVTSAEPVDFQQLLNEVESYSFGSTYLSDYLVRLRDSNQAILNCFIFIPYETSSDQLNPSAMSFERNSDYESQAEDQEAVGATANPTIVGAAAAGSSAGGRLAGLTKHESMMTGEELDEAAANGRAASVTSMDHPLTAAEQPLSKKGYRNTKVALSHHFRTVRTLSKKCKECDVMNFNFQGLECTQCGICVHKKCVDSLVIKCGLKTLPTKRTNIFQLDLCNQSSNNEVPFIVKKCIQEINKRGLSINGLYRVSGVKSQVEKLVQDFEIGRELVDLSSIAPTVLTSVLKFYFRAIPTPLLTYRLYSDFIQIGKRYPTIKTELSSTDELELINNSSSQSLLKELRHTCNKLPEVHLNTLDFLMKHLKKVADNPTNNMPANNLGIVFGPTLLRANESATSLTSLVDTVHQNRVVELLIINYNELFGGNLVEDEAEEKDEFDEIIEGLKTIANEENSEDDNAEIELDNLIQDLNRTEFGGGAKGGSTAAPASASSSSSKHHLQSKDSEDYYAGFSGYLRDSTEGRSELRTPKFAPRPSLHELRKQFFTSETASISFGTSDDLADKRSLNTEEARALAERAAEQSGSQTFLNEKSSIDPRSAAKQSKKPSVGSQLSQSKSPKSSTLQLFKSKDDREPKYV